ncbi:MAG: DUF3089 domain-containing protein [Bacteroidota bacterium]
MKNTPILLLFFLALLSACSSSRRMPPEKPYEDYPKAETPNYGSLDAWCSHPQKEDYADKFPAGVSAENQAEAKADVFFVHPTTFYGATDWNADTQNKELNTQTDTRAIMHQASIFNHSCKVYAPRYRQMIYGGYLSKDTASKRKALTLAYQDVKKAFQYYLDNLNEGRPIIIAGHSQGAFHAQWLLQEFFDGKELQNQLVAAYVPGWPFKANKYEQIPVCTNSTQNECVMGWNTWKVKSEPESLDTYYKDAVVVNPLNWRIDGSFAEKDMHKGFLNAKYSKIKRQALFAQAHKGILWVKSPLPLAPIKNFHVGDFNLFWLDVRENVEERVQAFLERQK